MYDIYMGLVKPYERLFDSGVTYEKTQFMYYDTQIRGS